MRRMFRVVATWALAIYGPTRSVRAATAQQTPAPQQILRGTVRDSSSLLPLPGAVVSAFDTSGATLSRTIADGSGRWAVTIGPRAARLHLIRIGFRPRDVPIPRERDVPLELTMSRLPALLEAMRVSGEELCPGSADRGAAFQLWEQARAGLLATIVARETKPAKTRSLVYNRHMPAHDDRVLRQTARVLVELTSRPFLASADAPTFARVGYLEEDASGRTFNAPDADVLLDESFAATHCFHLEGPNGEHREQIGLAFTPVPNPARDTLVDVRGVIWIDGVTPQLRSLEFLYTALEPAAIDAKAGGHIEFRTMPNGIAFIERWHLLLPLLGVPREVANYPRRDLSSPYKPPPKRQDRHSARVAEMIEAGGMVLEAVWPDGDRWYDPPTAITGVVAQGRSEVGLPNARVILAGTTDTTISDGQGRFTFTPVVPGTYTVVAVDSTLHDFVPERTEQHDVTVRRGEVAVTRLRLASIASTVAGVCHGLPVPEGTSVLVGHLTLPDSIDRHQVRVHAEWQDFSMAIVAVRNVTQDVEPDWESRFLVCGVERERPVKLQLSLQHTILADTTVSAGPGIFLVPVNWRMP
jgi:hypothetical protein